MQQAYGEIYQMVQKQASVLAYIDTFSTYGSRLPIGEKKKPGQTAAAH